MARNRMRMRLLDVEQELFGIITEQRPVRAFNGELVTTPDGAPVMEYSAPPRDRTYAIKVYLEYSMARPLAGKRLPRRHRRKRTPIGEGMSVADAAAAIIEASPRYQR